MRCTVAGRTLLSIILNNLERISFNDDPLQFLMIETTYHPFISFFHMTEIVKEQPELFGIRKFTTNACVTRDMLNSDLQRTLPPLWRSSCAAARLRTCATFCASGS